MTKPQSLLALIGGLALLGGCQQGAEDALVTADNAQKFDAIGEGETLNFAGTEPFWGGEVTGQRLRYTTPENIEGRVISVKRFAGLGGLGLSGTMGSASFDMAVTPAVCSDTMSDRIYPFAVTLNIGGDMRNGCGWTKAKPYTGDETP